MRRINLNLPAMNLWLSCRYRYCTVHGLLVLHQWKTGLIVPLDLTMPMAILIKNCLSIDQWNLQGQKLTLEVESATWLGRHVQKGFNLWYRLLKQPVPEVFLAASWLAVLSLFSWRENNLWNPGYYSPAYSTDHEGCSVWHHKRQHLSV